MFFVNVFYCLFVSILVAVGESGPKKFYIYDGDDWAIIRNSSLIKRDVNERLENALNDGAGPIINITQGSYHTDQYQLFSMIFNRAMKAQKRTLNPAEATSFVIPYDFASDAAYYKNCAKSNGVCYDFRRCPLGPNVQKLLLLSPWFQRKNGFDHLLIVGMNYAMDHYILKPNCKSLLNFCSNCTKFAIDDYSFMYSGDAGIVARGDYWHAAPFPADFHWTRHVQRPFPWENTHRPVLVSYIGSTKSYYGPARRLRTSIVHYCEMHVSKCIHQSYGLNGTRHSFHVDGHMPLELSQRSVFCFQPIGDLMTRKGLFDSILQGCIPVVFDQLTAAVMYTWHWEETFWRDVIVELPFHGVAHRYLDPVAALHALYVNQTAAIRLKQRLIRSRVFELQYGLDSTHDVYLYNSSLHYVTLTTPSSTPVMAATPAIANNSDETTGVIYSYRAAVSNQMMVISDSADGGNWPRLVDGSLARDAYDICMDLMLGWHSGELPRVRNATVPECWDGWLDKAANRCKPGKEPEKNIQSGKLSDRL